MADLINLVGMFTKNCTHDQHQSTCSYKHTMLYHEIHQNILRT